jgi:hypothetical protein
MIPVNMCAGCLALFMIMSHEFHHENMHEGAEQGHSEQHQFAGRNMEKQKNSQPDQWDQAARQHDQQVFLIHGQLLR